MRNEIETAKQALEKAINHCDPTGLAEVQGIIIKRSDAEIILSLLKKQERKNLVLRDDGYYGCPCCGSLISSGSNYCALCGQGVIL